MATVPACFDDPLASPKPSQGRVSTATYPQNVNTKVDILFMVDNSSGTEVLQVQLKERFSRFLQPLLDLAQKGSYPDLHIGVVTSDFGAGASGAPGCTWSSLVGGGDQGKLVAIGKKANANCQKPKGSNFIEYAFTSGAPANNLPDNQSLVDTFSCMASVGDTGCGFEHQLESVYAALHNNIAENQGFLRDDAKLMVVFVTDEDDASAPPDSDIFNEFKVAQYGYEDSYSRQTRFAVMCGDPAVFPPYADSKGPLSGCRPAPNPDGISGPGKQFDVSRYRDFFTLPRVQGGVKDSPLDVMVVAIDGPEQPFQVILSNPGTPTGQPYIVCSQLNEAGNPPCVPVLQHSCVNPQRHALTGDPAVRINDVVRSVKLNQVTSVCEGDYGPALESAGRLVVSTMGASCVRAPFPRDSNGKLINQCNVQDITLHADGSETVARLPTCDDPDSPSNTPCWVIETKPECAGISPDGVGFSVRRGATNGVPNQAPPHTSTLVECAAKAGP